MFNFNNLYLVLFYYLSVAILYYMKHNPIFFYLILTQSKTYKET